MFERIAVAAEKKNRKKVYKVWAHCVQSRHLHTLTYLYMKMAHAKTSLYTSHTHTPFIHYIKDNREKEYFTRLGFYFIDICRTHSCNRIGILFNCCIR